MEFRARKKPPSQSEPHQPSKKRRRDETFVIGEKILCFEPDDRLEKVLYDAKIKEINETRDKRGRTINEYLVHFQGWSNSWDRRVSGDFILKDSAENRNLQKELAEKSQLQLGAYLYRKERKKRKKMNEMKLLLGGGEGSSGQVDDNLDLEYYSSNGSSLEEGSLDDRVFLHIGDVLKKHIENDFEQVHQKAKPVLPSPLPVVTILEHFVKSYAMKVLTSIPSCEEKKPKRRHSSIFGKKDREVKENKVDFELIAQKIDLCKEVADGLRIYFNFILQDFLLYPVEKDKISLTCTREQLRQAKRKEIVLTIDDFYRKSQPECAPQAADKGSTSGENNTATTETQNEGRRMSRLRSQSSRTNEDSGDKMENASAQSSSSGDSVSSENKRKGILSKSWFPLNAAGMETEPTKILEEVFTWRMLPDNCEVEPSMIFGINYLCRLVVKLPEFLSATPMNEEKLKLLLKYLDDFVLFLEENTEMFGPHNYLDGSKN